MGFISPVILSGTFVISAEKWSPFGQNGIYNKKKRLCSARMAGKITIPGMGTAFVYKLLLER
jgi:hypothetical protein